MLKKFKNNKLYYDKYLYKLGVLNSLAPLFRNKNFSFTRSVLDQIQNNFEEEGKLFYKLGLNGRTTNHADFNEAKILINEFQKNSNFTLRIESFRCYVYSNDRAWILHLSQRLTCDELWEPVYAELERNTIVSDIQRPYQYKITLGARTNSELAGWAKNNKNKVWIGSRLLKYIEDGGYTQNMYFYVRDERILELMYIIAGDSIVRVDKIVYNKNIDK